MRLPYSLLCVVLALAGQLQATPDYSHRPAMGLAIYKAHDFAADKTAHLLEYRNFSQFPAVTIVTTAGGARLTIPARSAEVILIPYPGRGDATPDEALAVIEVATPRFPQFRRHLRPLQAAWIAEQRRPPASIAAEIADRENRRSIGESFISWVRQTWPQRPPPTLPPSPFEPMTTDRPAKPAAPEEEPATEESSLDLERNLELIQQYQKRGPEAE